jgi:Fe2+ or Zn2+ uptake regulation protein
VVIVISQMYLSKLVCQVCNTVTSIPRRRAEKRENNHVKHMWCYKCKEVVEFKENIFIKDFIENKVLKDEGK